MAGLLLVCGLMILILLAGQALKSRWASAAGTFADNMSGGKNQSMVDPAESGAGDDSPGITGVKTAGSDKAQWNLLLVNPWNEMPADYDIRLTNLSGGQAIDERCYPELQQMMDDCRAAGLSPLICSSYRSWEKQESLFRNQTASYTAQGYSKEDAQKEARKAVAVPGTSEHQLGLAADIVDASHQLLDSSQEDTKVQKWLMKNSWKYGFILRYPNDKSELTGIIYEPWHYRYVGKEAAKEIYDRQICLEEYLEEMK